MVIQAIGPLEVDPKGAIPVLCQGPAILHSTHQSGHLDIALRAGGLSWRASALILCLGMYQVACVVMPTSGAVLPLSCDSTHYRRITSLYHHQNSSGQFTQLHEKARLSRLVTKIQALWIFKAPWERAYAGLDWQEAN